MIFQCHMILQKSYTYSTEVFKKKTPESCDTFFIIIQESWMIWKSKSVILNIFKKNCNNVKVFIVTDTFIN